MSSKKTLNTKTTNNQPDVTNNYVIDFFENLGSKAIWLCLGLIGLLAFIVFKDFIFQQKIYLFKDIGSDSLNASWPWMVHSADYISKYGTPSWSFNMGMGQNILSFSFYDPFDYILYFLGSKHMPYLLVYKEIAKILLAGFLFFNYLKLLKASNYTATIGAMLYAFCGYMIVGSGWFLFSFEVFNAALLLLSFELLYQKNKWYWFILPIFLIGISRPFNFWLYALFLLPYILFRVVQTEGKLDIKKTSLLLAKIIGVSVIGIGLSAPIFLEHLQVMIESPRGSGPDSYFHVLSSAPMFHTTDKVQFGTGIMRFFSSDILGSGINFKGWQNLLEAPIFYCGLPCLLLFPQFFQFLNKPVKRAAILLLSIWLLPIIFPYFRQAIWLFSGDYYRTYSFFVGLILIFFSISAFDKIIKQGKLSVLSLVITLVLLLILINYPFFQDKKSVDSGIRFFAEIFLILYAFILYNIPKQKNTVSYKYAFIACLFIELLYFSWCTVNRRDNVKVADLKQPIGYNDYSNQAINYLHETDHSFYRVDKNYFSSPAIHGSLNDGMVQDYYGTSSYNAFNQKYYIDYLKTMGVLSKVNELESRWSSGLINRFILESLNDVKYILTTKGYTQPGWHVSHDSIAKFGDVLVLKNKFNLPLGYGYSSYIKLSDFEKLSPSQKDFVSTKTAVINDEDLNKVTALKQFELKDTVAPSQFTFDLLKQNMDSLQKNTIQISEFKPTHIKASINLPADRLVYASIPFDKGWTITDNGNKTDKLILSGGMTGLMLTKGNHALEFTYTSLNFKKGLYISVISFCIFIGLFFFVHKKKNIEEKSV
ncbi:MAG TPA: YfhO family protein [Bacteroidia bacterium]|nr:YfhO family protein [Bacteroidia bacterium]